MLRWLSRSKWHYMRLEVTTWAQSQSQKLTELGQLCPHGKRASQGSRHPPPGERRCNSPGRDMLCVWSGWREQIVGKAVPICSRASISSTIVDHVGFFRRLEALPRTNRPCFARERATLMRLELCMMAMGRGYWWSRGIYVPSRNQSKLILFRRIQYYEQVTR